MPARPCSRCAGSSTQLFAAAGARLDDHLTLRPAASAGAPRVERPAHAARPVRRRRGVGGRDRRASRARRRRAASARSARARAAVYDDAASARSSARTPPQAAGAGARAPASARPARARRHLAVRDAVAALAEHFHDPAPAPALRPLRDLLRLVAVRGAGHADADRARRAGRRLVGPTAACTGLRARWRGLARARRARRLRMTRRRRARSSSRAGGRRASCSRAANGLDADACVVNADVAALAAGRLGAMPRRRRGPCRRARSARCRRSPGRCARARAGFPLVRHNVFFSADYARRVRRHCSRAASCRRDPTVYVCAQDRGDDGGAPAEGPSGCCASSTHRRRATGAPFDCSGDRAMRRANLSPAGALRTARASGRPADTVVTTPADFERLFPATGGALYGRASHGWRRRSSGRARAAGCRASTWRGAARIRARACRWRRCRGGSRRRRLSRTSVRHAGRAGWLRVVVRRRAERRRPPWARRSSPSSAACSRPTTRWRAPARRRRPARVTARSTSRCTARAARAGR